MDLRTNVIIVFPDYRYRFAEDLDLKYSIREEYYEDFESYDQILKSDFNFFYLGYRITSRKKMLELVEEILREWTDISHVVYGTGGDCDYFYKLTNKGLPFTGDNPATIDDLIKELEKRGLPALPVSMHLDGPFEDEFSFRGDFENNVKRIYSLPRVLYKNGKLLVPEEKLWSKETEVEIFKYFQRNPQKILELSPRNFEYFVASIFKEHGFDVQLTPASRDGGLDIIAVQNNKISGKEIYLIECKRYKPSQKIGIGHVQRLFGAVSMFEATKGIFVTTSSFTETSKAEREKVATRLEIGQFKTVRDKIELKDMDDIVSWIKDLGLSNEMDA